MATLKVDWLTESKGERHCRISLDADVVVECAVDALDPRTGFPGVGSRAEAVVSWPLQSRWLTDHLQEADELFAAYGKGGFPVTLQMRLEGNYYEGEVLDRLPSYAASEFVSNRRIRPGDALELLFVGCGDLAIEWIFSVGGETPVQCSVACTLILAEPLARFFRAFHADERVRNLGEISQDIFANTANPPLNALRPLQIIG